MTKFKELCMLRDELIGVVQQFIDESRQCQELMGRIDAAYIIMSKEERDAVRGAGLYHPEDWTPLECRWSNKNSIEIGDET